MITEDVRTRIIKLSEDEFKALFWQVYGSALVLWNPDKMDEVITGRLSEIEARR